MLTDYSSLLRHCCRKKRMSPVADVADSRQGAGFEAEMLGGSVAADGDGDAVERLVDRGVAGHHQAAHDAVFVLTAQEALQLPEDGTVFRGSLGRGDAAIPLCHAAVEGAETVVETDLGVGKPVRTARTAQPHGIALAGDAGAADVDVAAAVAAAAEAGVAPKGNDGGHVL